jgi:16S rRNA (adenine1518-N6/adenine1519-N6)-dimethyltransferase
VVPPRRTKRFGQHHLAAGALCRPLLEFLRPAGERVVEIGPGGGVLTAELLAAGVARLLALEVDPAWAGELARRLSDRRLLLAVADALKVRWERLRSPTLAAGNLPYNVATALIQRLLPHHRQLPRAAFLVQREVAERLVAAPGDRAYGALSVLVAARSETLLLGRVKAGSFRPPPKVDGAFVGFHLRPPPLPEAQMATFTRTVHLAFGQRRKRLRNALAAGWGRPRAERLLAQAGVDPACRAEQLPLTAFVALARAAAES